MSGSTLEHIDRVRKKVDNAGGRLTRRIGSMEQQVAQKASDRNGGFSQVPVIY
jgi:hypothetical protein